MNLTPFFVALHAEDTARQRLYRDRVQSAITPEEVDKTRRRLQCQLAFGTERFRQKFEEQLQRRTGPARIGRPRKSTREAHAASALGTVLFFKRLNHPATAPPPASRCHPPAGTRWLPDRSPQPAHVNSRIARAIRAPRWRCDR